MTDYEKTINLWRRLNVQTEADIDRCLENFKIFFAYNSGKIENNEINYDDTREIFENNKVINYTGDLRAIFETKNQRQCYEIVKRKLASEEPLSIELIKKVHEILTAGTYDDGRYFANDERPGEFKKHNYVVGRANVGSKPNDVEQDLIELVDELNNLSADDVSKPESILKIAAYFHVKFEHIHPFSDGNGRVGRTLLNYFLMSHNHPPLTIHEEDKRDYYEALRSYDNDENIKPMIDFLKNQLIKTWEAY